MEPALESTIGPMIYITPGRHIRFRYKNWRGEVSERRVAAEHVIFGRTEHHHQPQWLLSAYDLDRKVWRMFALKDMSGVQSE